MSGRHYPRNPAPVHAHPTGFTGDDLRAALAEYRHPLGVGGEELDELLDLAERHAQTRMKGGTKPG
jgi:CBS-domain-containing membrane protein